MSRPAAPPGPEAPVDAEPTFLFTDIEGSSGRWEQSPAAMDAALQAHDRLCAQAIAAHGGRVLKSLGDGLYAVFDDAAQAVAAVLRIQLALVDPAAPLPLAVRCGLHRGPAVQRDGDYFGPVPNRAARIMAAAHGGQVLLSQAVADAAAQRLPPGTGLLDLGRVRLRDLAAPEHVHQLQHAGLRERFPPLRSLAATPNNLAQQLSSFVGRDAVLAQARERLQQHRLLTLLGAGGIGKSRLAVQLGAEVVDDYPDGVWLVELAALSDARLVPQALASVLGVKEGPGQTLAAALAQHARDRRMLVIVDNCEHLLRACADLAKRLLQAGAGVRVLATSRTPLRLAGEACYPVPALGVPAGDGAASGPASADELMRHAAVRLFADRAAAVQPGFAIGPANAAAVADICRRLDGIPLAIELAAARTRALPVQAIAQRLDDRFRLLASGDATVLPRQRTLRALIEWSHDLLAPAERVLYRRLAVFSGGWTLEAAENVAGDDADLPAAGVADLLAQLVDQSLVALEPDTGRYRMLDTVRQHALDKLGAAAGDAAAVRGRHLAHHLALAEAARAGLQGADAAQWLTRLDADRENLLAAHAGCNGNDPAACAQGLRLVYALRPYWFNRGLLGLGFRVAVEALLRPAAQQRDRLRCQGLSDAGRLAYFMGRYPQAREYLQQSLDIAREIGATRLVALVLQPLGMACEGVGDVAAARAHLEEAVALAREFGDRRELAAAINSLAQLHRTLGEVAVAEPLYRTALALARELGQREPIAVVLLNLAMVSVGHAAPAAIAGLLLEVLAIAAEVGSTPAAQSALDVCAGFAAQQGDAAQAARFHGCAEARAAHTGLRRDPTDEAFLAPLVQRARAALGAERYAQQQAAGAALDSRQSLDEARSWLESAVTTAATRSSNQASRHGSGSAGPSVDGSSGG